MVGTERDRMVRQNVAMTQQGDSSEADSFCTGVRPLKDRIEVGLENCKTGVGLPFMPFQSLRDAAWYCARLCASGRPDQRAQGPLESGSSCCEK